MVKILARNWVLIFTLLLAFLLRVYRLDYLELFGDEVDAGYQSYSLLTTGRDYKGNLLPTYIHSFSEWRAPGLIYAMIPFIKLFGLNEWGVRMTSVFFGMTSILFFYLVLGLIGVDKKVKLISIFLLAITPWHIQYSRSGFELTLLMTVLFAGIHYLIMSKVTNNTRCLILAGILFGLSFYVYSIANVLSPLIILLTVGFIRINRSKTALLLLVVVLTSLPIAYHIIQGHGADRFKTMSVISNKEIVAEVEKYRNATENKLLGKIFYNKFTLSTKKILFNYTNAFSSAFLFGQGDITFRHSLHQVGNMFWITLPLLVYGVAYLIRARESWARWLIGLLLISPVASALTIDGYNHASRLFLMVFPLVWLTGYGFVKINKIAKIFVVLLLFTELINYQFYYWNHYRNESWRWWHSGYKEAMSYVLLNKDKYRKIIMDNTYEPTLVRFLFWNKYDPRLVFGIDDQGDFCLEKRYCFVNFGDRFNPNLAESNTLYLVAYERNGYDQPEGIKIEKVILNTYANPIFYLGHK
ncbi:MAG: glycosyltransferase family 39 protein [Candidatus Shapirobacteria bacterium]|jgi:4-amino-4-deoxy-L-arabinose transferase-like glycosyltransferase